MSVLYYATHVVQPNFMPTLALSASSSAVQRVWYNSESIQVECLNYFMQHPCIIEMTSDVSVTANRGSVTVENLPYFFIFNDFLATLCLKYF